MDTVNVCVNNRHPVSRPLISQSIDCVPIKLNESETVQVAHLTVSKVFHGKGNYRHAGGS